MSTSTKKPLQQTLPRALKAQGNEDRQLTGQEWPCTVIDVQGAIVTVVFEVESDFTLPRVTCAIAESRYVRLPVQEGDKGFVTSASTRLGGVTGLGAGLAPLSLPGNLGALVFVPLGNKAWTTIDPDAVVIQAPNGAKILTDDGASEIIVDTDQVKVIQGATTVTISGGNIHVVAPGDITVDCPDTTINGDLTVNGAVTISETIAVTGNATFEADVSVTGAVSCATMTCAGAGSFATLTVGGKSFLEHTHLPGGYHIGASNVTGNSGAPS